MQSQTLALSRATALQQDEGLDFARIGAFSAVIAIHVIAAGLLLAPTRIPDPGHIEQSVPIIWVLPATPPPPLVPIEVTHHRSPTTPDPVTKTRTVIPPTATHAVSASNDAPPIAASTSSTSSTVVASGGGTTEAAIEPKAETPTLRGSQLAYASAPAPVYPRNALRDGIEGTVVLEVTVDENGRPIDVVVATSSGSRELDRAAREQVLRAWRFQPAMQNGHAVRAIGRVPVNFTLNR